MIKKHDEELYQIWDKRWQGSEQAERLTPLGRLMFRAKKKALARTISGLKVKTVIEVGCGLGHTLEFYYRGDFNCIGIDISPHAVAVCKNKGLPAILQNLEDVIEQYDLVSSDGMLEHFLDFAPYARHLMRISRQYVLLIQPNHDSFFGKTLAYLAELLKSSENVFEYNYRIKDFVDVFHRNGFEAKQNYPIFFDVFRILLFEKGGGVSAAPTPQD
ncbi:MAG: methyltransferase domain-containing protein [Thermodesulfobacteriota bacterium]|nr:methyltransferase domain-containing protein [Thermodesulfobacteriota bacterium]